MCWRIIAENGLFYKLINFERFTTQDNQDRRYEPSQGILA
jgi:hypothetical protein